MSGTVVFKGVTFSPDVAPLVPRMALVNDHRESLQRLEDTWDQLGLLAQMTGSGTSIAATGAKFHALTGVLLDALAQRLRQDALRSARAKAQTLVDLLVRNLFERTADVGFLALDSALVSAAATTEIDAAQLGALQNHLNSYQAKYSVYDDILLLAADGSARVRLRQDTTAQPDAGLAQATLRNDAPYLERFGPSPLLGGQDGLLFCAPVRTPGGHAAAVLCLSFALQNEMASIFAALTAGDEASVLLLLDAQRTVVASSDVHQVGLGVVLPAARAGATTLRFAGRDYLTVQASSNGYQGYVGLGWVGCVLVPLDVAFDGSTAPMSMPKKDIGARLSAGNNLFGEALRTIPIQAKGIQHGLERLVWNGQLRLRKEDGGDVSGTGFANVLLERVTATGRRISQVFEEAIAQLQQSAEASVVDQVRAAAALGSDILDRSFYERANDCRWWALDETLRTAARERTPDASAQASKVLAHINGLYTVYAQLLLLDEHGKVLASSRTPQAVSVATPWMSAAGLLRDESAYVRAAFGPSPFYDGRGTSIFAAHAHTGTGRGGTVATVFDSAVQMDAMLHDVLPRDAAGAPLPGALALFLTRNGTVVASTDARWQAGDEAPLRERCESLARGASNGALVELGGVLHAAGIAMTGGYREYDSAGSCGPDDMACLVLSALGAVAVGDTGAWPARFAPALDAHAPPKDERTGFASVRIGPQWLGLATAQVVEAIEAPASAAGEGRGGIVIHDDRALAVIDLHRLGRDAGGATDRRQALLVVCEDASRRRVALRVDELGPVFDVPRSALRPLPSGLETRDPLATALVDGGEGPMLTVIDIDALHAIGRAAARM
jgi:chemotaxis signal transduction protein